MLDHANSERLYQLSDASHVTVRALESHRAPTTGGPWFREQAIGMLSERAREAWCGALDAHQRAAELHEDSASLLARRGNHVSAVAMFEAATREHRAYEQALARHPEWARDALAQRDGLRPLPRS